MDTGGEACQACPYTLPVHHACMASGHSVTLGGMVTLALPQVVQAWGSLDILVNCAAGNFLATAEELTPNGFRTGRCCRFRANALATGLKQEDACMLLAFGAEGGMLRMITKAEPSRTHEAPMSHCSMAKRLRRALASESSLNPSKLCCSLRHAGRA